MYTDYDEKLDQYSEKVNDLLLMASELLVSTIMGHDEYTFDKKLSQFNGLLEAKKCLIRD